MINRLAPQLRRSYYSPEVKWPARMRSTQLMAKCKADHRLPVESAHKLLSLANQLHAGNVQALANNVRLFFQACCWRSSTAVYWLHSTTSTPDYYHSEFIIDQEAAEKKLSCINIHKAPGPDWLSHCVLRDFCDKLSGPVCATLNASAREGFVPPS